MSRMWPTVVGIFLICAVAFFVYQEKQQADRQALQQQTPGQPLQNQGTITLAAITMHNDTTSCWSAINGTVYDLTSWIPRHPGGEQAILSICGIDGSSRFNAQHGSATLQQRILSGFKIGTLIQ